MDEFKLYEYETFKPELEDLAHHNIVGEELYHFNHNHDPRNGQFTTGPGGGSGSVSSKKKKKNKKSNKEGTDNKNPKSEASEKAIKDKDLLYVKEHVDDFSTQEINELLNRINAEARLDEMINKNSPKSKKEHAKKIISSPAFKLAASLTLAGLGYATYNSYKGVTATPKRLTDKSNPYYKQFAKDALYGAEKYAVKKGKKKLGLSK